MKSMFTLFGIGIHFKGLHDLRGHDCIGTLKTPNDLQIK